MARAQRGNEDLQRLLRLLMNERTELRPRDENRTFFEEFKSNIEAIKKSHYRPEEIRKRETRVASEKKVEEKEKADLSTEVRGTRGRDMLLLKLERQSIRIETLEAEVRKLRLQNQQLRETNHGLSNIVEREKRARETAEREILKVQKALRVQAAQAAQEVRAAQALQRRPQEVHFSRPAQQPGEPQKLESTEAIHQLRTGLALVHQRHEEAKRKWEASVAISKFQERVIRDLKAKLGKKGPPAADLTEELLRGCEFDSACDDRADTTQLILGRPRGSAFDHLGPSPGEGHSRFKAAALAVLFTVRMQRAVAGRK